MANVVKQVNSINASQLTTRVELNSEKDEITTLADTFNLMLDRLQEAFELQKSFVSNASHGIRTPLTSIYGQVEIALFKQRKPEEYETTLKTIYSEIRSLTALTNSLLYLAQSSNEIEKLLTQKIRVDEILLLAQTEITQLNPNFTIVTDYDQVPDDANKLTVLSNENLLKIVFFNIMDNACKYSEDHKVYSTISFSDKFSIIRFEDHGRGISKSDQKRIFEPFYRGSNTSDTKGHGIGLSLVKKILDLHNGSIHIQSQIGTGTTIILNFPVA